MAKSKWLGLPAIMPATALIFLDQTILPVALPTIQSELGASMVSLEWTINVYMLALAAFVLVGGKWADRIGYRACFLIALTLFTGASLLCGFSASIEFLIAARALQGMGAALMMPASSGIISHLFEPQQRGKAIGLNVSVGSLFMILGPIVGGFLTQQLTWRWIFWINLPLGLVGGVLILWLVPTIEPHKQKIDLRGFFFFLIASTSLIVWLMQGAAWGWLSGPSLCLAALAFAFGFLLLWREKTAEHPFLDLALFRHPHYTAANGSAAITQAAVMVTVFWSIYFQETLGYSSLEAGFISFISCLPIVAMAPLAGYLSDRYSPRVPTALGFTLMIFSFYWFAFFSQSPVPLLTAGLLAFGGGITCILTPASTTALNAVPPNKIGTASGMLSTTRFLSGSLGLAAIGAILNALIARSFATHGLDPAAYRALLDGSDKTHTATPQILDWVRQAQIDGFFTMNLSLALAMTVAFAFVFVLFRLRA